MGNQLHGLQAYQQNRVSTADPGTILLALYQGAIDFLNKAKESMQAGDVAEKGRYINKTLAILAEFQTSLDFEVGGEIAQNLDDLYIYMSEQITAANMSNDPKPIDIVLSLLETLQEGWEGAVASERKRAARGSQGSPGQYKEPSDARIRD